MTKAVNKLKVPASLRKTRSHFRDPLDKTPDRVGGYSRTGAHASHEVKNIVIAEIRSAAKAVGFANKDIANLLAFAEVESGLTRMLQRAFQAALLRVYFKLLIKQPRMFLKICLER